MLKFLKESRNLINKNVHKTCIILGNESCDLDSAVCSITLAYLLQSIGNNNKNIKSEASQFLPVLNIPRCDYPLKTEVCHLLRKHQIDAGALCFKDELQEEFLENSEFILVDHHLSPYLSQAVAIYDHRPRDKSAKIPEECRVQIELVGSCATLIAEAFLEQIEGKPTLDYLAIDLLRHVIVLDTINFSKEAGRATAKDESICDSIEKCLRENNKILTASADRQSLFDELVKARADISRLTAAQLLRKDRKFVTNAQGSIKIALPGFPQPVQEFIKHTDAEESIKELACQHDCDVVLLLGMFVKDDDGSVHRDLGVIDIKAPKLSQAIVELLCKTSDPDLRLESIENCTFMNGVYFKQQNMKATRKHILPLVNKILEEWKDL